MFGQPIVGNRSLISTVYVNELTDKLTYVFQNDAGWQFNAFGGSTLAQWYGINHYLFYAFNETWTGGMRFEWFRDDTQQGYMLGDRVIRPAQVKVAT